jgi:hypothetical protein
MRRPGVRSFLAVHWAVIEMDELFQTVSWIAVGLALGWVAVRAFWRFRSAWQLRRAADRPLHSTHAAIWRDPGAVERLDLAGGPGGPDGAPVAPFTFIEEHFAGSRPCVSVRDAHDRIWRLKWGDEVQVETLATRLAWGAGYFVETTYYIPEGRVEGITESDLKRAGSCVDATGVFTAARFEREEEDAITHFDEHSWSWVDNPFVGTRELNGLKILMMWLSNWDAKDVRDVALGSNTAIYEARLPDGSREARYLISDWGGAFGRWGNVVNRGRWDCQGFTEQTPQFVTGVDGEFVKWGYSGQRTGDIAGGIRVSDVAWLLKYLGRLTESQIASAVRASGGTDEEATCFTRALMDRLAQLRAIAASPSAKPSGLPSAAAL